MGYLPIDLDDEDIAVEVWNFAVDFDIDGDDITILPTVRWASDESAAYAQ